MSTKHRKELINIMLTTLQAAGWAVEHIGSARYRVQPPGQPSFTARIRTSIERYIGGVYRQDEGDWGAFENVDAIMFATPARANDPTAATEIYRFPADFVRGVLEARRLEAPGPGNANAPRWLPLDQFAERYPAIMSAGSLVSAPVASAPDATPATVAAKTQKFREEIARDLGCTADRVHVRFDL